MNLIAAIDLNRCLGKDGKLLYCIKKDLNRFKELTDGKVVVMGRKTWDSLPNAPLKNRTNVIITRDKNFKVNDEKVIIYHSLEEAEKSILTKFNSQDIFIIGGESIYKYFMNKCNKFYITQIYEDTLKGDKFLPNIPFNENEWSIQIGEVQTEKGIKFSFSEYVQKPKVIKCNLNKKIFCELINKIQYEINKKDKLFQALQEFDEESYFYPTGIIPDIIDFLKELMEDKNEWIEYFIYELDFGKEYCEDSVKINGKAYELKTSAQLYNLLWEEKNLSQEKV